MLATLLFLQVKHDCILGLLLKELSIVPRLTEYNLYPNDIHNLALSSKSLQTVLSLSTKIPVLLTLILF